MRNEYASFACQSALNEGMRVGVRVSTTGRSPPQWPKRAGNGRSLTRSPERRRGIEGPVSAIIQSRQSSTATTYDRPELAAIVRRVNVAKSYRSYAIRNSTRIGLFKAG